MNINMAETFCSLILVELNTLFLKTKALVTKMNGTKQSANSTWRLMYSYKYSSAIRPDSTGSDEEITMYPDTKLTTDTKQTYIVGSIVKFEINLSNFLPFFLVHNALHTCAVVGVDCRAIMSAANARQAAETTASSGAICYALSSVFIKAISVIGNCTSYTT